LAKQSIVAALLLAAVAAHAQSPTFEVASVKPSAPVPATGGVYFGPARGGPGTPDPEQITWTYPTLKTLLLTAYDLKNYQIAGPAWLDTERYDIIAKVPSGTTKEQLGLMWQNLLTERFRLTLHHDPKEFQVEQLTIAPSGSKLKETAQDLTIPLPPGPPQRDSKGQLTSPGMITTIFPDPGGVHARTIGRAQPLSQLIAMLANSLSRPVLDKTGLTGKYDFDLEYSIDIVSLPLPPGLPPPPPPAEGDRSPLPDLKAAVQQNLGLRLAPGKANLDVLVIDKADKVPTEN